MQTMSQDKDSLRKERAIPQEISKEEFEVYAEASYFYTLYSFSEFLKCKRFGSSVWKDLDSETKAMIRNIVALEQLKAEGKL
jgi:hypothetical protein